MVKPNSIALTNTQRANKTIPSTKRSEPDDSPKATFLPVKDTTNSITFHCVPRHGGRRPEDGRPRPTVAKFEYFKQKELVKSRGRKLKGTNVSINDEFPQEFLQPHRVLFPVRKHFIDEGSQAVISVDKQATVT